LELGFERPVGAPPRIRHIDVSALWATPLSEHDLAELQPKVMATGIADAISNELEELGEKQYPVDLLVLVPDTNSSWTQWTRAALEGLNHEFLDYTRTDLRRAIPRREQIRLCTYHSARGIEALQVADKTGSPHRNLGYIVLSRALLRTTVLTSPPDAAAVKFLDNVIARVSLNG
jgi:hypothetical protein